MADRGLTTMTVARGWWTSDGALTDIEPEKQ